MSRELPRRFAGALLWALLVFAATAPFMVSGGRTQPFKPRMTSPHIINNKAAASSPFIVSGRTQPVKPRNNSRHKAKKIGQQVRGIHLNTHTHTHTHTTHSTLNAQEHAFHVVLDPQTVQPKLSAPARPGPVQVQHESRWM